ncbi:hypothetical protein EXU48_17675 [Occultella glacieicola]|uniref:Phasin domain-containing protein n=1 Tax=Occultella glacieicola TaxID=2518684 RepID=A0ABY2E1Q3_9MICO|nr:hypothetical protein [Occultella glacieicola]TDE90302.1 hypothetical protein EXU48_17675 [Occultella glacieicola]
MDRAAGLANKKVLLNPLESPAVVRASDHVATVVVDFHERLGIESDRQSAEAKRWRDAATELKDKVVDAGAEGVGVARRFGTQTLDRAQTTRAKAIDSGADGFARASEATGKFFGGIAERARHRQDSNGTSEAAN